MENEDKENLRKTIVMEKRALPGDGQRQRTMSIMICLSYSSIVLLRLVTRNHQPLFFVLVLALFYGVGVFLRSRDYESSAIDHPLDIFPTQLTHICLPIIIFHSSIGIDFSELTLNVTSALLCMGTFGLMWIVVTSFIIWPILHFSSGITFSMSVLLASILSPKQAEPCVQELDHVQGRNRHAQTLLKFEQLCSTWFACVIGELTMRWIWMTSWPNFQPYYFIITVLFQSLGVLVGLVWTLIVRIPLSFAYNDITAQAVIFLSSVLVIQMVSVIVGFNQGLTVGTFSISLSSSKVKMSKHAEEFHIHLWNWFTFLAKATISMLAGLLLGLKRPSIIGIHHYGIIVLLFCIVMGVRLLVVSVCHLVINLFHGPTGEINWKRVVVITFGPFSGSTCIMLALHFLRYDEELAFQNVTYVVSIVCLSVLFNASVFHYLLDILGMFEYKRATIVNMNMAMSQVNACRESAIFAQKADLVVSDANWIIVENMTRLPHPYKKKLMETGYSEDRGDFRLRTVTCPNCNTEVVAPPTKSEVEDMIIEAKQRVLKIQLVSFTQQYENGTLSRHSYRQLFSITDSAANSKTPVIDSGPLDIKTQESRITRFFRRLFSYLTALTRRKFSYVPENLFRLMTFYLVTSRTFITIMAILVLTDTIIIFRLLIIWHFQEGWTDDHFSNFHLEFGKAVEIFNLVFFVVFSVEILLQLLGLGVKQYLSSHINKMELSAHFVRTIDVIMYICTILESKHLVSPLTSSELLIGLKWLLLIRLVRVYVFVIGWLPKCLSMVEKQVEDELMRNYEVGKGYLVSLDKVMRFLSHVALYETVYTAVKSELETERKKVVKVLSVIQKEYPTIAITVKTRHAIRLVINSTADCINDLKEDGILDLNESAAIFESLEKVKDDLREMPMVDPALAQGVLKNVPWFDWTDSTTDSIVRTAKLINYDYNDTIIHVGDDPVGLYILVSGLVKAYYNPTSKTVQLNAKFGMLPNFDFFDVLRFDQAQDSYVVSGSAIGELGIVTGRRYDMTVVCETSVQLYFISWKEIKSFVYESRKALAVQNEIWKYIGIRIAIVLIQSKPQFSDWSKDKLLQYLDTGWVPSLDQIKCINIPDEISELILIEGICKDPAPDKLYVAPFHLPKGIKLLWLPDHPKWQFQTVVTTKILVISSCLQHSAAQIATMMLEEHKKIEETTQPMTRSRKVVISDTD